MHFKTSLRPPPVSKDVAMLFLDHSNWLSAIIGMAFVNNFGGFSFPRLLPLPPSFTNISALPILHNLSFVYQGEK